MHIRNLFLVVLLALLSPVVLWASGGGEVSPEEEIKKEVVDQLAGDTRVDASEIKVEVKGQKVILTGTVQSLFAREAAISDAWEVDGVALVESDLSIGPADMAPALSLELAVENALLVDSQIDASDISVTVNAGTVVLEGTVDEYWKKLHAEEVASTVDGVLNVDNQIAVAPEGEILDKVIAEEVMEALNRNRNVNADNVEITVEDGFVTMEGTVSDWVAHGAASRAAANTPGVKGMANLLSVSGESVIEYTDADIARLVRDQLEWDSQVDASDIEIEVDNGEVTLSGTVPSFSARTAALEDALSIAGVRTVHNEISVKLPEPVSTDPYLSARAESRLMWSASVEIEDPEVQVIGGLATVNGEVVTAWEKDRAEEIVMDIEGIIGVVNKIVVVPTENIVDSMIAEDVVDAFDRNTSINVDMVTVEVDSGIVTLTGEVSTFDARESATDIAMSIAGVKLVVNNIEVNI